MNFPNRFAIASATLLLALSGGHAFAAGKVTGVFAETPYGGFGTSFDATVNGTIQKDVFGKGCMVRVSLKYKDNTVDIVHPSFAVGAFPATGFYLKPSKDGLVTVIAEGGTTSFFGWPPCTGKATVTLKPKKTKKSGPGKPRAHKPNPINPAKTKK